MSCEKFAVIIVVAVQVVMSSEWNRFPADGSEIRIHNSYQTKNKTISRSFCQPEVFRHHYFTAEEERVPMTNSWKRAQAGEYATTRHLCLLPNGLPLTRACLFNARVGQAEWEKITRWQNVSCLRWTRQRTATYVLNQLQEDAPHDALDDALNMTRGVAERRQILHRLSAILKSPEYKILPADVHYFAAILRATIQRNSVAALSREVFAVCSHLMAQNHETLRLAAEINATNALLETFERYMDHLSASEFVTDRVCADVAPWLHPADASEQESGVETVHYAPFGVRGLLSRNIGVFLVDPRCAEVTGIAVYGPATSSTIRAQQGRHLCHESRQGFLYRFVRSNETVEQFLSEPGLKLASFFPASLWATVRQELEARDRKPTIVFKVYATDGLFVQRGLRLSQKPSGQILSISVPGFSGQLTGTLPLIMHSGLLPVTGPGALCGYWNYTTWLSAGVETKAQPAFAHGLPLVLCGTSHLTQFALLIGGSYRQSDSGAAVLVTPLQQRALDIISLLGCSLSLFGLGGIWLTAALFRRWRALASNKLLLHLCSAATLQLLLFVFVNTNDVAQELLEKQEAVQCVVLGASMQYLILVLFSWQLIVAYLQFQRYVTVIGIRRPKHYILKSALVAWGWPLVPTLLAVAFDAPSYTPSDYDILYMDAVCYPSGAALVFGVVLPVTVIVSANLCIFVCVFCSISQSLKQSSRHSECHLIQKQIRLSVLLFFLFGLSWIFGIFDYLESGIVFSYLFCLTATVQGFVLFVYFVLLDAATRGMWHGLVCGASKVRDVSSREERRGELQSMTSTTGFSSSRDQESKAANGH